MKILEISPTRMARRRYVIREPVIPGSRPESFGRKLRALRERVEMTVPQLARKAGLTPDYLYKLEGCRSPAPAPERIRDISRALGCDEDELLIAAGQLAPDVIQAFLESPSEISKLVRQARKLGEYGRRTMLALSETLVEDNTQKTA